ncbi:preprotein translocase subunit SecA [Patescibacteria group bacterium]|nr:preprotein translocase subunit SecA [Patescibacteria group bacterium]
MAVLGKLFGASKGSSAKSANALVGKVNALESSLTSLSAEELRSHTTTLKERIGKGESLQEILPFAFALAREAARRTLGQRPFDVQLMGGAALHEGKIAEMKTGEGKTLAATLPVYLNALEDKGVHVVTVNDYLAKRDTVWMGQIYHALGLSVACITHDASFLYDPSYGGEQERRDEARDTKGSFLVEESYLRPISRREAYGAAITYGTNNEFGFDYLRDNMAADAERQAQRGHHFAILDEIDSILIDEARTPLIISAPDEESSSWYREFSRIVPQIAKDLHYEVDEKLKAVTLTEEGVDAVERILGMKDIYQEKGIKYLHHLEQALRANVLFEKDRDYVVRDGQVILVDEFTGRLLPGRRYSGGLHQALEAKEGVSVQPESLTLASITFQNYFRMYGKLAGMTGTAATSSEELYKVYGLEVVAVPTNKPLVRKDLTDRVYQTEEAKFRAVAKEVKERHEKGQPVLVGTVSISKNEYVSKLLEKEGVPHEVLNAKNHEREAQIIAQAGRRGQVTVATNMAGRGVDIILGGNPSSEQEAAEVRETGGLYVMGTERHEARRIDNQLRGRAGRQGDPGSSQFFVSLEDDLVRVFGAERIKGILERFHFPEDEAIESGMVSKAIESAQSKVEGFHFDARKHLLEYDDVLNKHREAVYRKRGEVLRIARFPVDSPEGMFASLRQLFTRLERAEDFEKKVAELGEESIQQIAKAFFLKTIDTLWMEHLENMEQLRDSVRLRAYGQQDPLVEYKNEGHRMFQEFFGRIETIVAESLLRIEKGTQERKQERAVSPVSRGTKIGRNDPCPCGSGKKWKKCGFIGASEHKP